MNRGSIFNTEILQADDDGLEKAALLLREAKLVAVPTETVYGLAADARNDEAIKKIFLVKGRPITHPLILHVASMDSLEEWAQFIPASVYKLADHFWPGPLTLLLHKRHDVSGLITANLDTIAVRIPAHPLLRKLIAKLNTALVAPSANKHTKLSPTSAMHVFNTLRGEIPAVLDGGPCSVGIESTILDLSCDKPVILRKGPITKLMLEKVLNMPVNEASVHAVAVPGNMQRHYQTTTPAKLVPTQRINDTLKNASVWSKNVAFMYYSDIAELNNASNAIRLSDRKASYAKMMYDALYRLDQQGYDEIIIEKPPCLPDWADILDRLGKASFRD